MVFGYLLVFKGNRTLLLMYERADGRSKNLVGKSVIQSLLMEQVLHLTQAKPEGGAIAPPPISTGPKCMMMCD